MDLNNEILEAFGFTATDRLSFKENVKNFICVLNKDSSYFLVEPVETGANPFKIQVIGGAEGRVMTPKTIRTVRALNQYMCEASLHLGSQARAERIREALNSPNIFKDNEFVNPGY